MSMMASENKKVLYFIKLNIVLFVFVALFTISGCTSTTMQIYHGGDS